MRNLLLAYKTAPKRTIRAYLSQFSSMPEVFIDSSSSAVEDCKDMIITENFITKQEEATIMKELRLTFRRKYEYSHWDEVYRYRCIVNCTMCLSLSLQAITGYRETEKDTWQELESQQVVKRLLEVTKTAMEGTTLEPLSHVHILDLAPDG